MASKPTVILTDRDSAILAALSKTPLEARQLLKMSETFALPFTHERLVRRRLQQLVTAGFLSCFQYATTSAGAVNYYKLSKLGYRLVHGDKCELPSHRAFGPVALALQEHTRALADFIVHTHVTAHNEGLEIGGFYRENELKLTMGDRSLQPDSAFQLVDRAGRTFNYLVEVDCGTEPVRSTKQRESLQQKIAFYDRYHDRINHRFRVLFLFSKHTVRLNHLLLAAGDTVRDPQRTLVCATALADYVGEQHAMTAPVFLDHHGQPCALVPDEHRHPPKPNRHHWIKSQELLLTGTASVW